MNIKEQAEKIETDRGLLNQHLSEIEATRLAMKISAATNMPCYSIRIINKFRGGTKRISRNLIQTYQRLGQADPSEKKIELYADGHNVGVLLHELAHQKHPDHSERFWLFLILLYELYDAKFKSEFFPEKMNTEDALEIAVQEMIENSDDNIFTMREIGQKLVDLKINNLENIESIKVKLIEYGMKLKR